MAGPRRRPGSTASSRASCRGSSAVDNAQTRLNPDSADVCELIALVDAGIMQLLRELKSAVYLELGGATAVTAASQAWSLIDEQIDRRRKLSATAPPANDGQHRARSRTRAGDDELYFRQHHPQREGP